MLPAIGVPVEEVLADLERFRATDRDWRAGRVFGLVYDAGDEVRTLLERAVGMYLSENALNLDVFPSLRRMQRDVVEIASHLLHGDATVGGYLSSGGTESIFMAMKAARDQAFALGRTERPVVVLPTSAHPAFDKAAHYLGMRVVRTSVAPDLRADVDAMADALDTDTIMLVASAPTYPHGVVDPVPAIADLATSAGIALHVDACLGGFVLPFLERLGHPVPLWDFRVEGVTSISADLHKYGYAAKGASVTLYRDDDLRKHQLWQFDDWLGGRYTSATVVGSRPGAAIASAWAVLHHLGEDGYLRLVRQAKQATDRLVEGVASVPGLRVVVPPDTTLVAIAADEVDVFAVGDLLAEDGWVLDRQSPPDAIHATVTARHDAIVDEFVDALRAAVARVGDARGNREFSYCMAE